MSIETMKDGKLALRVQVRTGDDGWTVATLEVWALERPIPDTTAHQQGELLGAAA